MIILFPRVFCTSLVALGLAFTIVPAIDASKAERRVKLVRVPGDGKVVKAKLGADGTIHVLLDTEDGPRYVKSTDQGITFSAPIPVVNAASQKSGLKFQAEDLAVGKDGRVHIAMSNN